MMRREILNKSQTDDLNTLSATKDNYTPNIIAQYDILAGRQV